MILIITLARMDGDGDGQALIRATTYRENVKCSRADRSVGIVSFGLPLLACLWIYVYYLGDYEAS